MPGPKKPKAPKTKINRTRPGTAGISKPTRKKRKEVKEAPEIARLISQSHHAYSPDYYTKLIAKADEYYEQNPNTGIFRLPENAFVLMRGGEILNILQDHYGAKTRSRSVDVVTQRETMKGLQRAILQMEEAIKSGGNKKQQFTLVADRLIDAMLINQHLHNTIPSNFKTNSTLNIHLLAMAIQIKGLDNAVLKKLTALDKEIASSLFSKDHQVKNTFFNRKRLASILNEALKERPDITQPHEDARQKETQSRHPTAPPPPPRSLFSHESKADLTDNQKKVLKMMPRRPKNLELRLDIFKLAGFTDEECKKLIAQGQTGKVIEELAIDSILTKNFSPPEVRSLGSTSFNTQELSGIVKLAKARAKARKSSMLYLKKGKTTHSNKNEAKKSNAPSKHKSQYLSGKQGQTIVPPPPPRTGKGKKAKQPQQTRRSRAK